MKKLLLMTLLLIGANASANTWDYSQSTDSLTGEKEDLYMVQSISNKVKGWLSEGRVILNYSFACNSAIKIFFLGGSIPFQPPKNHTESTVSYRVNFKFDNGENDVSTWEWVFSRKNFSLLHLLDSENDRFMERMLKAKRISIEIELLLADNKAIAHWDLDGFAEVLADALANCQRKK